MLKQIVAALALAIAFVPATSSAVDVREVQGMIVDTPDGIKIVPVDELDHNKDCGGTAPVEFYCSTGEHVRGWALSHGFRPPYPQSGTLESRVISGANARYFACTFTNGALTGCQGSGTFPAAGSTFTHDCWSYVPGTNNMLPLPREHGNPSGIPGGAGSWTCQTSFH